MEPQHESQSEVESGDTLQWLTEMAAGICRTNGRPSHLRRWVIVLCLFPAWARQTQAQSVDDGFNPGADHYVFKVAMQANGKILVGGSFTQLGGWARNYIGRLNADGSLDWAFNPEVNGSVS